MKLLDKLLNIDIASYFSRNRVYYVLLGASAIIAFVIGQSMRTWSE